MIWVMQDEQAPMEQSEVERQASRARSIIYWVMFLFMVLPFVAAWLTGALRF